MNNTPHRDSPGVTPVPLARDLPRLLLLPMLVGLLGVFSVGLGPVAVPESTRLLAIAAGAVLVVTAMLGAAALMSVRLDVLPAGQVRLSWLAGSVIFRLVPGPVTRVPLPARGRQPIRGRFRAFGLTLGRGALHDSEPATVVKLARATSLIAIPTDRGRLAVAPADERALIAALTASARLQQAAAVPPAVGAPPPPAVQPTTAARWPLSAADAGRPPLSVSHQPQVAASPPAWADSAGSSAPTAPVESAPPTPRVLSGIERHRLEMERAARAAAEAAAAADAARRADDERSAVARRAEEERAAAEAAAGRRVPVPSPGGLLATAGGLAQVRAWIFAPRRLIRLPAARGALPLSLAPTAVAGVAAALFLLPGIAILTSAAETGRLALGLLLAGPLSTVGSLLARYGWPRLAGLVAVSGLFALVLLIRAALG